MVEFVSIVPSPMVQVTVSTQVAPGSTAPAGSLGKRSLAMCWKGDSCAAGPATAGTETTSSTPRRPNTISRCPVTSPRSAERVPCIGFDIDASKRSTLPVARTPRGSISNVMLSVVAELVGMSSAPTGELT